MNRFLLVIILVSLFSCNDKQAGNLSVAKAKVIAVKPPATAELSAAKISERLKRHFDLYRIKPSIEINNTSGNDTIKLGRHTIKCIKTEEETKIKIDNDLFSLKDYETLNVVAFKEKDSVAFTNNWDQIKLFKFNNRELIGIRFYCIPCTGLGCDVTHFLIYDVKTKAKSFFGTFAADNELELFDFANDKHIDYVSKTSVGNPQHSDDMEFIYELYSMDKNGKFKRQKDNKGRTYQIKYYVPDDNTQPETLTEHWITKIKS